MKRGGVRALVAASAACLGLALTAPAASADTYVSGGARTCSGSTRFVGVLYRGNGTLTTYTDNHLRQQVYFGSVATGWYESSFHYIGSWKVVSTDSLNASATYSYCYYR